MGDSPRYDNDDETLIGIEPLFKCFQTAYAGNGITFRWGTSTCDNWLSKRGGRRPNAGRPKKPTTKRVRINGKRVRVLITS